MVVGRHDYRNRRPLRDHRLLGDRTNESRRRRARATAARATADGPSRALGCTKIGSLESVAQRDEVLPTVMHVRFEVAACVPFVPRSDEDQTLVAGQTQDRFLRDSFDPVTECFGRRTNERDASKSLAWSVVPPW